MERELERKLERKLATSHRGEQTLLKNTKPRLKTSLCEARLYLVRDEEDELFFSSEDDAADVEDDGADSPSNEPLRDPLLEGLVKFIVCWRSFFGLFEMSLRPLLLFLKFFLSLASVVCNAPALKKVADCLPKSIAGLRKLATIRENDFFRFIICPTCDALYSSEEVIYTDEKGCQQAIRCQSKKFPHLPPSKRNPMCNVKLVCLRRTASGVSFLKPLKEFAYRGVKNGMSDLINQGHFLQRCQHWKKRTTDPGTLTDVYDGLIWKSFNDKHGNVLSEPRTLSLMLNVDWFQPFKHTIHSVGVMYLACLNLPREERYKEENIIIAGVIPGPKEPKLTCNTYLGPLVNELDELRKGVWLGEGENRGKWKAFLLCVACDTPAARKLGGFPAHSAVKGCNKCLISFVTSSFGEKPDYSNFDKSSWPARSDSVHRKYAEKYRYATTMKTRKECMRKFGARYSVLHKLPYFDSVKFFVVDPMHNLFLGTAKHTMRIWKRRGLLDDKVMSKIQKRVDRVKVPRDIGRLPSNLKSYGSGFTADQWRNWTEIFSLFALHGLLPGNHMQCWLFFVQACQLICRRRVSLSKVAASDENFVDFCTMFSELYGTDACTPNMHLHLHLSESVHDYGPVYSFWLYSFERFNGILSSYYTNNRNISQQLLKRFIETQQCRSMAWSTELKDVPSMFYDKPTQCMKKMTAKSALAWEKAQECAVDQLTSLLNEIDDLVSFPLQGKTMMLRSHEYDDLLCMLRTIFGDRHFNLSRYACFHKNINVANSLLESHSYSPENASYVSAFWYERNDRIRMSRFNPDIEKHVYLGRIRQLFQAKVAFSTHETGDGETTQMSLVLACVDWCSPFGDRDRYGGAEVWYPYFEPAGPSSYIPVARIMPDVLLIQQRQLKV